MHVGTSKAALNNSCRIRSVRGGKTLFINGTHSWKKKREKVAVYFSSYRPKT